MKSGLRPMFRMRQIEKLFDQKIEETEGRLLEILQYTGEYFVKIARDERPEDVEGWNDVTGNLRSSIGYVIVRDGEVLHENFKKTSKGSTDGSRGLSKGQLLARSLARTHRKGLLLIGVAGMEYALHVENLKGKDVITHPELMAKEMLKDLVAKLKKN